MDRRSFIGTLASVVATATLDPEKLLWKQGAKTIFVPSPVIEDPNVIHLKAMVARINYSIFDINHADTTGPFAYLEPKDLQRTATLILAEHDRMLFEPDPVLIDVDTYKRMQKALRPRPWYERVLGIGD